MKREDQGALAIIDHHHLHQREGNTALHLMKEVHKREVRHHQGTIGQPMVLTKAGALKMMLEWMNAEILALLKNMAVVAAIAPSTGRTEAQRRTEVQRVTMKIMAHQGLLQGAVSRPNKVHMLWSAWQVCV